MLARTYMDIDFSLEPRSLTISRSDEENFEAFLDLVDAEEGPIIAPAKMCIRDSPGAGSRR